MKNLLVRTPIVSSSRNFQYADHVFFFFPLHLNLLKICVVISLLAVFIGSGEVHSHCSVEIKCVGKERRVTLYRSRIPGRKSEIFH